MKIDAGIPTYDPRESGKATKALEEAGYDGAFTAETSHDPFLPLVTAAIETEKIELVTAIAVAFARNPMTLANLGYDLHKLSEGRFILGLGSQIKPHITKRFSMPWSNPAARMKELIEAIRAIWDSWQNETPLEYESGHYNLNLNVPLFTPSPLEADPIPIHIAAVNPGMFKVAVEIAEGVRLHPVCGAKYISNTLLPLMKESQEKIFEICLKPLVASARDEETLVERKESVRQRLAFYLSTPAYAKAFEVYGLEDLCVHMNRLSRESRWEDMSEMVTNELLEEIAIVGLYGELAEKIKNRYGGFLDRIELSIPVNNLEDEEELGQIVLDLGKV